MAGQSAGGYAVQVFAHLYPCLLYTSIFAADKEKSEAILKREIKRHLSLLEDDVRVMFKLSIPSVDGFYADLMEDQHVVRVVALSGGYSRDEANERLSRNPGLIASFSRALSQGLNVNQTPAEFDQLLKTSIDSILSLIHI